MITFTIPGDPRGKGRPKFARRGAFVQTYTDDKTAAYENLVALAARDAMKGRPAYEVPVAVVLTANFKVPASASKRLREEALSGQAKPTRLPDLDNILKAVLDGCNQVVFSDDRLVVQITALKQYGPAPSVVVSVMELNS